MGVKNRKPLIVMKELKQHPISLEVPPFSKYELDSYRENIKENGLIDKVVIYEGMVLGKWHGYKICLELGIRFETEEFRKENPKFARFFTNAKPRPRDYVLSTNIRRNLTKHQKACYASNYFFANKPSKQEVALKTSGNRGKGTNIKEFWINQVARMFQLGMGSLARANYIKQHHPALFKKVFNGEMSLYEAYRRAQAKLTIENPELRVHHRGTEVTCIRNIEETKEEVVTNQLVKPAPSDSDAMIESFQLKMNSKGWIFEMLVKDGKYYGNFYGNGFPMYRHNISALVPRPTYKQCVIDAAQEKFDLIKKGQKQAA